MMLYNAQLSHSFCAQADRSNLVFWRSSVMWRGLFPFRKRSLPLLTVDAIIGNQAFSRAGEIMSSGLCYNKAICNVFNCDSLKKGDV